MLTLNNIVFDISENICRGTAENLSNIAGSVNKM